MPEFDWADIKRRMHGAVEALNNEFAGLRTGRANPQLLEHLQAECYGAMMPFNQLASISVPEPRMLNVQVWDGSNTKAVERAIRESDLGLNPQTEGNLIRVPIPELNEERRHELSKVAAKYTEQARVAVRNIRRDGMEKLKRMEKDHEISQDQHHRDADELQKLTDGHIKQIDDLLASKEQDIMQV